MTVKSDVRYVNSKRDKTKKVKKTTYKCEGSYVDIDGIPHRYHKRGFSTADQAKEWERTFLLKVTNEISDDITYGDLCHMYMESKQGNIKERSYNDINCLINTHILPYWNKVPLHKITLKKIETWQKELLNKTYYSFAKKKNLKYSNEYLESIQSRFKSVIKYGIAMGSVKDIKLDKFCFVKHSDEQKKEMLFWQPDEFFKFISVVDQLHYKALFNTLYWCGLRQGELLALTWEDIDLTKKIIKVRKSYTKRGHKITTPKTENSIRDVIIPEMCFNVLDKLHKSHMQTVGYTDNKFVFNFNKPLDENSIRNAKNRYCKIAEVKQIRIHDFRHSHVSLLIDQGFNAFDIAKRLGHTVEMVNNVYGHWFVDAQQKMVDRLNEISKNFGVNLV